MGTDKPDSREVILPEIEEKLTEPPMYNVLIHNDDFTTKEFVVGILMSVFNKSLEEATQIMWAAHRNGTGICGVYPYELAETKVNQASSLARENEFPLRVTMEEE
jgi:ATP-dependent Clp protease adaptor protein ClpS